MTIEFFTGFEGCGTAAEVQAMVSVPLYITYSSTLGYNNGKCAKSSAGSVGLDGIFRQVVTPAKTKVVGWHSRGMSTSGYNSDAGRFGFMYFSGPDLRFYNTTGGIAVYRASTLLFTEDGTTIDNLLHHIEVKVFVDGAAGTVQIKQDGALIVDRSGLDTGTVDITEVGFGRTNVATYYLDNCFIASDWKGELKSLLLKPNADDSVQFTPDSGVDNFSRIDQAASDGDTTYNSSGTVGHKDIFGYEDIPAGLVPLAATLVTRARKDDTGERQLEQLAVQDAVEYTQGTKVLNTDYIPTAADNLVKTLGAAPDATAWTREKFNAIKWGYKVAA